MKEITLLVIERTVPSYKKARLHTNHLIELGIKNHEDIEIITQDNSILYLTAYADNLVDMNEIRIGVEEMKTIDLSSGDCVIVRRKKPITELLKGSTEQYVNRLKIETGQISQQITNEEDKLKEKTKEVKYQIESEIEVISDEVTKDLAIIKDKIVEGGKSVSEELQLLNETRTLDPSIKSR